ncbi:MAG: class I SAM-dependent methyltransferase [Defluviitaleaceae bacterium]|nr:class I SAM-dependent methyltransferase [Defluviitaleaceae bacterium]
MDMYRHFSRVYDIFMDAVPYRQWAGYIDEMLQNHNVPSNSLLLDLGCGTGTVTFMMAQKGYELIGVDASADMLSEASAKMHKKGYNILFLNQDILELDLYGTVDAAYSICDTLNYILTEEEFEKALKNVALYLNPGGIFIFDLKTDNKYRKLGSNTYHDIAGKYNNASYVWKNHYNPSTGINEYKVQFFLKGEENFLEVHRQRAYSTESVTLMAQKTGLQVLSIFDNYTCNPAPEDSERVTYLCRLN